MPSIAAMGYSIASLVAMGYSIPSLLVFFIQMILRALEDNPMLEELKLANQVGDFGHVTCTNLFILYICLLLHMYMYVFPILNFSKVYSELELKWKLQK